MIPLEQALRRIVDSVAPVGTESVSLAAAGGRVLAEGLCADRDHPATDRSAMDGFAVRADDLGAPPTELRVVGEVQAGSLPSLRVGAGEAARIFTGAVVPDGADTVVMVERTVESRERGTVTVEIAPPRGEHIRRRGQDRRAGEDLVTPGVRIAPAELAALASIGRAEIDVHLRPRVAVLSTGDEIVEPHRAPGPHQVRNSNGPMLCEQAASLGCDARYLGIAGDERERLESALRAGLDEDVLLVTGGVSVGEYDLVRDTLEGLGLERWFHGVAMKPGKPVLAGRVGDCVVVGLPGNPVSSFACFEVLVAPMLRKLAGWGNPASVSMRVRLTAPLRRRPGRTTFHLARLAPADDGWSAAPVAATGSGDVLALVEANGFVITPVDSSGAAAGDALDALPWPGLLERLR